ncbi:MAG: glycosyltransferase [Candidatus Omnitrophica bacterium]|nr:glycosyltransferase [Candidatus Omnitrophota bacterium]
MISLIFPTFNEEENLKELYSQISAVIDRIKEHEFELVFVDDGSTDKTPEILRQFHEKDNRIKAIRFTRNYGSHAALAAGLIHCKGDCAINMSADLQDPPELIVKLLQKWNKPAKIIWGIRAKREGETMHKKFFAGFYYLLMNWLTDVTVPPSGADVFLIDRCVINAYKEMKEKHTSVFMVLAWLGFSQDSITYVKKMRQRGLSKWTVKKRIKLAIDSLLSFSDVFIRSMSAIGIVTAFLGFLYASIVVWTYFRGSPVQGWSSLIVVILIVGGIQMIMLGVLGEYLWRTFDESRKRPRFIIEYTII